MKTKGKFFSKLMIFLYIALLATVLLKSHNTKQIALGAAELSPDISVCYDYNLRLNDQQRVLYNYIIEQLQNGKLKVKSDLVKEFTQEDVEETVLAVLDDHPEFFWLMNGYKIEQFQKLITFQAYNYLGVTISPEKYINAYSNAIENISSQMNNAKGTNNRIKFVHDYLVRSVSYNHEAAAETPFYTSNMPNSEMAFAGSSYGALVNSSAVCAGYAKAFQSILQKNGICCGYVTGEVKSGLHAWSVVNVNGRDYYFDVTWDDLGDYYQPPNDLVYTYYSLDKVTMEKDHWAGEFYQNRN